MLFFSLIYLQALSQNEPAEDMITDENTDAATSSKVRTIEIINNTRAGIVIFFRSKKGTRYWGANSSPGYFDIGSRTKDLRSFHRVFIL